MSQITIVWWSGKFKKLPKFKIDEGYAILVTFIHGSFVGMPPQSGYLPC